MKRPEQTAYLTPEKKIENFKRLVESNIQAEIFKFHSSECFNVHDSYIKNWLSEWGWKIERYDPDFRELFGQYYYILKPL